MLRVEPAQRRRLEQITETCVTVSTKPASTAGSAKSKDYRSVSTPPAASSPPSIGSPAGSRPRPCLWVCRSFPESADDLQKRRSPRIDLSSSEKNAAGLVELTARPVRARGREVEIEHLHAHLPRVLKAAP
ncbi:hypothetical protein AB0M50_33755 [Nonomuraea fuscirosea]|uniref:hypothetical protein n=1 Tax=Nonomuraea fuscirosea TaxID=1291556 RepID=UPI003427C5A2